MSTKEGYDGAYSALSNEELENYVEDICIGIALSDDALAIRKLIARYKSDLAAKDAEIAQWKKVVSDVSSEKAFVERQRDSARRQRDRLSERLIAKEECVKWLQAELAAVKGHWAETIKSLSAAYRYANDHEEKLKELRSRIEAAPVIHIACQGSAGVGVSTPKHAAFEGEGEWKAFHAVPVEEEK